MSTPRWPAESGTPATSMREQLTRIAQRMTVRMVMTPLSDLVTVRRTTNAATALEQMGSSFDQAPVLDGDAIVGVVFRGSVAEADGRGSVGAIMRPIETMPAVRAEDTFAEAAPALIEHPVVAVTDGDTGKFAGLLHFSDVNKHEVRANLYLWLAALEMNLARLLR